MNGLLITIVAAIIAEIVIPNFIEWILIKYENKIGGLSKEIGIKIKIWVSGVIVLLCALICVISIIIPIIIANQPPNPLPDPTATVVILGNHAGSREIPEEAFSELSNNLDGVFNQGCLYVIVSDSTPYAEEISIEGETKDGILKWLEDGNLRADSTEVDLLQAIQEARTVLTSGSAEKIEKKQIIIIDTGISTTGKLNFAAYNWWEYDRHETGGHPGGDPNISKIVLGIIDNYGIEAFPQLDGIEVLIIGEDDCFAAEADYLELQKNDRRFIKEVWKTILEERCHARVRFKTVTGWQKGYDYEYIEGFPNSYPFVSSVLFNYNNKCILNYPNGRGYGKPCRYLSGKIESKNLGFSLESSLLNNRESAKNYLKPYANDIIKFLEEYPEDIILVAASVIPGSIQSGISTFESSRCRAEMTKELLVENGVNESSLIAIGLGDIFPWKNDKIGPGLTDPRGLDSNRAIWFMLADADGEGWFRMLIEASNAGGLLPGTTEMINNLL